MAQRRGRGKLAPLPHQKSQLNQQNTHLKSKEKRKKTKKYKIELDNKRKESRICAYKVMAKKSWIERNKKKAAVAARYADLRAKLKAEGDYIGLTMLPRNASPVRQVNRCELTGRRHAFMRRFHLSRIAFRELANAGMIPGVTKSSW